MFFYEKMRTSIVFLIFVIPICSAGHAYAQAPSEVNWTRLVDGSDLMYDGNGTTLKVLNDKDETDGVNSYFNEKRWNAFLGRYIESLPISSRDATLRTLMHSYVKYDDLENEIVFRTVIGPKEFLGEERGEIYYFGAIKNRKAETQIEFRYRTSLRLAYKTANGNIGVNRIKIYADDSQFDPILAFNKACQIGPESECGSMSLISKANQSIVQAMANSKKSVIRFYGRNTSYDFILSESNKRQLKVALKSLSDINAQSCISVSKNDGACKPPSTN